MSTSYGTLLWDHLSALEEAYVNKRQKQKAEEIAVKVFQYSKCYTLKCF